MGVRVGQGGLFDKIGWKSGSMMMMLASIATDNFKITRVIILATPKKLTVTEQPECLLRLHPHSNVMGVHSHAFQLFVHLEVGFH